MWEQGVSCPTIMFFFCAFLFVEKLHIVKRTMVSVRVRVAVRVPVRARVPVRVPVRVRVSVSVMLKVRVTVV